MPLLQVDPDQVVPDQVVPDQVVPDHVVPFQVAPDHVVPDQVVPHEGVPDPVVPDQVVPDQVVPVQVVPFQVPPLQLRPSAVCQAIWAAAKSWLKMSFSPLRAIPPMATCEPPRASSSEPVPRDGAKGCHDSAGMLSSSAKAAVAWRRPEIPPSPSWLSRSVPALRIALTCAGFKSGRFCSSRATTPEVMAADSEVPLPRK